MLNLLLFSKPVKSETSLMKNSSDASASNRFLRYSERVAVVEKSIEPSFRGRVRYQGVFWSAQCEQDITLSVEDRVLVVGRRNITLIVEPFAV